MSLPPEREQLLMRHLDGQLSGAESRELAAWLREDAAARAWLRELAEQAVALGDLGREKSWRTPVVKFPSAHEHRQASPRFPRSAWLALAASVVLLAGLGAWLFAGFVRDGRVVVEVESVNGALSWTSPAGRVRSGLSRGERLPAGTFETSAEGAATLRFGDGTRLNLGGGSEVLLSDDGQKRALLRTGALVMDARPQPAGRPLVVRTPTALVEVLGTVFSVSAGPDRTAVNVEEGRVRVQRLSDGDSIEVPARHGAVASLAAAGPLVAQPSILPPATWRADFSQPPTEGTRGDWVLPASGQPGRMGAVPLIVGRKADDTPLIQHGISFRDRSRPQGGAFVTVTERSVVRLRYRAKRPVSLILFCITQQPGGRFGGNFELTLAPGLGTPLADGWRALEVPLAEFRSLQPHLATQPAGNTISHISVKTYRPETGLELAALAIEPE